MFVIGGEGDGNVIVELVSCQVSETSSRHRKGIGCGKVEVAVGECHLIIIHDGCERLTATCRIVLQRSQSIVDLLYAFIEKEGYLTCCHHLLCSFGRSRGGKFWSLEIISQDIYIFQVVVAVFGGALDEHTDYHLVLIVSNEGVGLVIIGIPMGTRRVVFQYRPSGTAVNGIYHTELRTGTAAVANGEIHFHVRQTGCRQRHFKILVMLRTVGVVGRSCKLVDGSGIQT